MAASVSVSVPIWLTLTRIELAVWLVNAALQELGVGDEQVVADKLDLVADALGQLAPGRPVVFGQAVFDGDDRVLVDQVGVVVHHLVAGERAAFALQDIRAVVVELGRGRVHRDHDLLARLVAGLVDGFQDDLDGLLVGRQVRREAAFVADRRRQALAPSGRPSAHGRRPRPIAGPRQNDDAPTGIAMNSCMSTLESACLPPFMMFIIGTGSCRADVPPM